jgi:hypothetical protein
MQANKSPFFVQLKFVEVNRAVLFKPSSCATAVINLTDPSDVLGDFVIHFFEDVLGKNQRRTDTTYKYSLQHGKDIQS